jgi:biopolymer transport protein ExbD
MALNIKKKEIESEIFTGSMADISFLLIIYFMVTSVFSATRGLDFALPEESQNPPEIKQEDSIDVLVGADQTIRVDGAVLPLEQLLPYVAEKLKQNPDKPVILRTEPEATYGQMITVFDELRQAPDKIGMDIKTISIPTQREIQNIWSLLGVQ